MTVVATGALLSSLVFEAGTDEGGGTVEGLLLGVHQEFSSSELVDDGAVTKTSSQTLVLRHVVTGTRLSFYDVKGNLRDAAFDQHAAATPEGLSVVGWFVARKTRARDADAASPSGPASPPPTRGAGLAPSLRDAFVHRSLTERLGSEIPRCVLLVVAVELDDAACTQAVRYRAVQQPDPARLGFASVGVTVKNLKHDAQAEYSTFRAALPPAPSLPAVARANFPPDHVREFEAAFDATVRDAQASLAQLGALESEVRRLEAENAACKRLLLATP